MVARTNAELAGAQQVAGVGEQRPSASFRSSRPPGGPPGELPFCGVYGAVGEDQLERDGIRAIFHPAPPVSGRNFKYSCSLIAMYA